MDYLSSLPEDCKSEILTLTTPRDGPIKVRRRFRHYLGEISTVRLSANHIEIDPTQCSRILEDYLTIIEFSALKMFPWLLTLRLCSVGLVNLMR
ncbi:hypothetical protein ACSBR2_030724 [Camellia fascicularis]